jgi:hypothetical protein
MTVKRADDTKKGTGVAVRNSGASLVERLRASLPEIERTVLARIKAVTDSSAGDPDYLLGLRVSVRACLEYALSSVDRGGQNIGAIPAVLLDQAFAASRNGVGLDTVLRHYLVGHTLLIDLAIREARRDRTMREGLQELVGTQTIVLDRVLAAVATEHSRGLAELRRGTSSHGSRLPAIERLLAGEILEAPELRYELGDFHLGLIAAGPDAGELVRALAARLDRSLLVVSPDGTTQWAWFGGRRPLPPEQLLSALGCRPDELHVAIGEPGEGPVGWRRSHRQARVAWPLARRGPEAVVRYADVALLASALQDDLLVDSLRVLYLEPLEGGREGGENVLFETLAAYFAAERSATSAAAALGVSRQAVNRRLRLIERRLGRPLGHCGPELQVALRIKQKMLYVDQLSTV